MSVVSLQRARRRKDLRNYRPVSLTLMPGKVVEQKNVETISRCMKNKKVTGSSWHEFTKTKSFSANLITFYDEMTSLVDEGRAKDVVYFDFGKAFHRLP